MKTFLFENVVCKLGQTKEENWSLLDSSKFYFYFFHLSAFPSCYVIAECLVPSDEIITFCARMCKNHTKYRNLKNIKVDYCKVDNLRKGKNVGEVLYRSNRKVKQVTV